LSRTYPNILTYEAVKGSEWNKVNFDASPEHNVTMPFMRTLAGAFDYGPGVMKNVSKSNFCALYGCSMTQGTRCHQLAMYLAFYSPLQFMTDVPTNYLKEPQFLDFLCSIPSVWDVTWPLDSRIGQYITIAKKKDNTWFAGSMTNWDARTLKIKCDFLEKGNYNAEIYTDGPNADRNGIDYKTSTLKVKAGDELTINMAPGGGWIAKFTPVK
jgi:alpha-glucosidase